MMKNKSKRSKTDDRKKKFVRAEDDKSDDRRCYNCGDKNHLSIVCSVKRKGVKCGEHRHIAAKCSTADSKHTKTKTVMRRKARRKVVAKLLR